MRCSEHGRHRTRRSQLRLDDLREVREHDFFKPVDFVKLISRQLPTPHVPTINDPSDISNYDHFDEPDLQQWDEHNRDDEKTFGFWNDMLGRGES